MGIAQIVFIVLFLATFWLAWRQFGLVVDAIKLGQKEIIVGDSGWRWRNVLLVAFGQQKMFKRWIPALFHFFIYAAFLLTQIELIEIIVDGFSGKHRFFAPYLGGFYTFLINFIEILSLLAFVATIVFLWRRNVARMPRFTMSEMKGWPFLDANLILLGELLLLIGIFSMNGADVLLQSADPEHYPYTGTLAVSSWLGPAAFGGLETGSLHIVERFGWWLHLLVVFGFITYLPYSKHLHIFFAFPNVYFAKKQPRGEMNNMPAIMNEVKSMMGLVETATEEISDEIPDFGADDVTKMSWRVIMSAYTCTECGRCTSVCPANITGKKLSPRKIVMNVRDRADEVIRKIKSGNNEYIDRSKGGTEVLSSDNFSDGKSLFDYISKEEIYACTTCNACVEACPVLINPLEPILELRRFDILTNSAGPHDWLPMFNSVENSGSVWQVPEERAAWTNDLNNT